MSTEIYRLIPKVMEEVPEIRKLRKHGQQKWAYRGFEDFLAAFHPALMKHGLFIVPEVLETRTCEKQTSNDATMSHVLVTVAYSIYAGDGSMIRAVVIGESWDSQDNASTKALDDAFTTFLTQLFCVPTGEVPGEHQTEPRGDSRQQSRPSNRSQAAPAPAPAAPPATVTQIDSARFFAFQREHKLDFNQANEIRLECTTGKHTNWPKAFARLKELAAAEASIGIGSGLTPNQLVLQGIVAGLVQLGASTDQISKRIAAVCDGLCEVAELDPAQTAKALSVLQRDLEARQSAAERQARKGA